MTDRSVAHGSFTIERTYPASPARVFAAFASLDAKSRMSVSIATVQLTRAGSGTYLVLTEQGAFLDGIDKNEYREEGTTGLLDKLGEVLQAEAAAN